MERGLLESLMMTQKSDGASDSERWRWWLGFAGLAALTLLVLGLFLRRELAITGGVIGVPLDDAWIHFQFARNIQQGAGFSYNPGEPTPGSTAPLWTILVALLAWPFGQFLGPGLALSAFFFLLTVWAVYGFTRMITGRLWPALVAGLGVILAGRLAWAGLAAMETTAFAALTVLAVWAYAQRGLRPLPVLLFALAGQLRPEGHVLFLLALADAGYEAARQRRPAGQVARELASAGLIYAAVTLPYVLFSLFTTGHPLPNTFYAKVGGQQGLSWRTVGESAAWHFNDNPVALWLALLGVVPLWRRSRPAVLWLIGLPLVVGFLIDFTWHHGRYTMPLIPFVMIAAATGLHWIAGRLAARPAAKPIVVLLVVAFALAGLYRLPGWATMLGENTREIEDIDVALGRWLAENTPADALIAVDDIGAIAFLSNRRIVDLNGLVSPSVWPAVRAAEGLPRAQVMTRILSELQPDYLAVFPLWRWDIVTNEAIVETLHQVSTPTHTIIFQPEAGVYRPAWPYLPAAEPQTAVGAIFGESIELIGFDRAESEQETALTLYWRSLAPLPANLDVFIHVIDEAGNIISQVDREPAGGLAPTGLWQPGDVIRDRYRLDIPKSSGRAYSIQVGLYERSSGERLHVDSGEMSNALRLFTISGSVP